MDTMANAGEPYAQFPGAHGVDASAESLTNYQINESSRRSLTNPGGPYGGNATVNHEASSMTAHTA
jgi:hypothetical protein